MSHYVYEIINNVNGKSYIGVHCGGGDMVNDGYLGSGNLIKLAVKKYGAVNFEKKILCVTTKDNAYLIESRLVDQKYVDRKDTYNLKVGGEGGAVKGRAGIPHSQATKDKLRSAQLGKRLGDETKRKISESNKGIKRPKNAQQIAKISDSLLGNSNRRGKPCSDEAIRKIKEARSRQVITEEHKSNIGNAMRGYQHERVTCPHCGKTGGVTGMKRWHFNKCKLNPQILEA